MEHEKQLDINSYQATAHPTGQASSCHHRFVRHRIIDWEHGRVLTIYFCSLCGEER
jgi:hypothetical protein